MKPLEIAQFILNMAHVLRSSHTQVFQLLDQAPSVVDHLKKMHSDAQSIQENNESN